MTEGENKQVEENSTLKKELSICKEIIQKLRKSTHAAPFLYPVDPQRLNIPDYYEKIKNPMDLATINKKIDKAEYALIEDMSKDIDLMFSNCYLYNAPDSAVYKMGQSLEKYYKQLVQKCSADKRRSLDEKNQTKKAKVRTMPEEEYMQCTKALNEIVKTKYRRFNWPFLSPVDSNLVPGYYDMIKKPMDLSKMRTKLTGNQYNSSAEFSADFDLMISNCRTFNAEGSEVYMCAEKLDGIFKQIFEQDVKKEPKNVNERIKELRSLILKYEAELRTLENKAGVFCGKDLSPSTLEYLKKRIESLPADKMRRLSEYIMGIMPVIVPNEMNEITIDISTLEPHVIAKINDIIFGTDALRDKAEVLPYESSSD